MTSRAGPAEVKTGYPEHLWQACKTRPTRSGRGWDLASASGWRICSLIRSRRAGPFDAHRRPLGLTLALRRRRPPLGTAAPHQNGSCRHGADLPGRRLFLHDRGQDGHRTFSLSPGNRADVVMTDRSGHGPLSLRLSSRLLCIVGGHRPAEFEDASRVRQSAHTGARQQKRKGPRASGARPHPIIFRL